MKKSLLVILMFVAVALLGDSNFIRNPDFLQQDDAGRIKFWSPLDGSQMLKSPNGFTIQPGKKATVIQHLALAPEKNYHFSCEVDAPAGVRYRVYVEYHQKQAEAKPVYGSSGTTQWKTATGKPEVMSFTFPIKFGYDKCYIVFQGDGQKPISYSNMKLVYAPDQASASVPANRPVLQELGGLWKLPSPHQWTTQGVIIAGKHPGGVIENVPIEPGKRYKLNYTVCGVSDSGSTTGFHEIKLKITPPITGVLPFEDVPNVPQRKSVIFTVPAGGPRKISLACSVNTPGSVRFSDFKLEEAEINPTENWKFTLDIPFYRNTIWPDDKYKELAGKIQADGSAVVAIISLDGENERKIELDKDGKAPFSFPVEKLPDGNHKLVCKIYDAANQLRREFSLDLRKYSKLSRYWKVLPNRYLECNGEVLFPVVIWKCDPFSPAALYYWGRRGGNVTIQNAGATTENILEKLDLAHQAGFKLMIHPGCPFEMKTVPNFKNRIKALFTPKVLEHPAFLGYFLTDEPLWAGHPVEPIRAAYEFLREFDPGHVVWINAAPRNEIENLRPYAEASDIYGVDIYPVPVPNGHSGISDRTLTCVGKYAARMNAIAEFRRPIWNALQGFAWHECSADPWNSPKKPYPTLRESLFMAYDTMLNGGNGYGLWGTGHIQDPTFYETLGNVTSEIHRFSGLFINGRQVSDMGTNNPRVRCAVWEYDGKNYYFILNLDEKAQSASVKLSEAVSDYRTGLKIDPSKLELAPYETVLVGAHKLPKPAYELIKINPDLEKEADVFAKNIEQKRRITQAARYAGTASWIWDAKSFYAGAYNWIMKDFTITDTAESAEILVVADDACTVYCNGLEIGSTFGHTQMKRFNIIRALKKGRNFIAIHANDAGALPCGALAELRIGDRIITTGADWKTLPSQAKEKLPSLEQYDRDAQQAQVICPYGSGAWRTGVRIID